MTSHGQDDLNSSEASEMDNTGDVSILRYLILYRSLLLLTSINLSHMAFLFERRRFSSSQNSHILAEIHRNIISYDSIMFQNVKINLSFRHLSCTVCLLSSVSRLDFS